MLPNISLNAKYSKEGGGPFFKGIKITSNDLIMYLESITAVSYTHLRAHETVLDLVCRLLLEKKKITKKKKTTESNVKR